MAIIAFTREIVVQATTDARGVTDALAAELDESTASARCRGAPDIFRRSHVQSTEQPTPYARLNAVLHELVAGIRQAVRNDFIGAYLQGSFAVGDCDQHSDADFVIAIRDELSEDEVAELQRVHERIYGLESEWARHLEGS